MQCRDVLAAEDIPTKMNEGQQVALSSAGFHEGLRPRWPSADKPQCQTLCLQGPQPPVCSAHSIPLYFASENRGGGALLSPLLFP